ncbi:MAG: hypothetical protein HQK67_06425 [Desulfamplus sp.]|nr:hypothetical protein [Desulfamplus sp.]
MGKIKENFVNQEDGEEELALIIKKAGQEARNRRKKALDAHFDKLNKEIKQAVYRVDTPILR